MNTTPAKVGSTHLHKNPLNNHSPQPSHLSLTLHRGNCLKQLSTIVGVIPPDDPIEIRIVLLPPANPLGLTAAQLQILRLLGQAKTAKQIALELGSSHRTIEKHIQNLHRKFSVDTTKKLILKARRLLYLPESDDNSPPNPNT